MKFKCKMKSSNNIETWNGEIKRIINYGNHYEIFIVSRSSIMVVFGKTSRGLFACIPDFNTGCHLVAFEDYFWNNEKLTEILGKVDGITVATALYYLNKEYKFFQKIN